MAATVLEYSQELEIEKVNYLSNKLYPQGKESGIAIEDSFTLEYFASRYCLIVSGEFSSQQYAIILKKGTVYTAYLNSILANLTNEGKVKSIIDRYIIFLILFVLQTALAEALYS